MKFTPFDQLDDGQKALCLSSKTADRVLAASLGYAPELLSKDSGSSDLDPEHQYYRDPVEASGMMVRSALAETGWWDHESGFPWADPHPIVRKKGAEAALRDSGEDLDRRLRAGVSFEISLEKADLYFCAACIHGGYYLDLFASEAGQKTLEKWGGTSMACLVERRLWLERVIASSSTSGDTTHELYRSWLSTAPAGRLWTRR